MLMDERHIKQSGREGQSIPRTKALRIRIVLRSTLLILTVTFSLATSVSAQQPFVTDDADTTPKGHFHFEFSNEFDLLQRSSFPNLKQNTADFELDYGVRGNLEVGVEAPLLSIAASPRLGVQLSISVDF
ncbi:MAG: hypothetical protein ABI967_07665 [bacterium]